MPDPEHAMTFGQLREGQKVVLNESYVGLPKGTEGIISKKQINHNTKVVMVEFPGKSMAFLWETLQRLCFFP